MLLSHSSDWLFIKKSMFLLNHSFESEFQFNV